MDIFIIYVNNLFLDTFYEKLKGLSKQLLTFFYIKFFFKWFINMYSAPISKILFIYLFTGFGRFMSLGREARGEHSGDYVRTKRIRL